MNITSSKHTVLISFLTFFFLANIFYVKAGNQKGDPRLQLTNTLDSCIKEKAFPGIQYLIFTKDSILFEYAGGFSDVINKQEMTFDNTLNGFSVAKLVTGIAILQLVEKGQLSLDDRVANYIVNIPSPEITIKELLVHSSGIPNPIIGNFYIHWENEHQHFNRDSLLNAVLLKNHKLKFVPGSKIIYSNLGYAILGKVIESITNMTYEDYVQIHIFDKLNLNNELCHFKSQRFSKNAKPYFELASMPFNIMANSIKGANIKNEGKWNTLDNFCYFNFPAHGGIIISAKEFAKIFQNLVSENSVLLSKPMVDLFFTEQFQYKDTRMAITWFISEYNGSTYYWHRGRGLGFSSEIRYYEKEGVYSLMLVNDSADKSLNMLNQLDALLVKF